jgi:hypothetical protein
MIPSPLHIGILHSEHYLPGPRVNRPLPGFRLPGSRRPAFGG